MTVTAFVEFLPTASQGSFYQNIIYAVVAILVAIFVYFFWPKKAKCSGSGSHSLFVANFDGDAVGSPPAPTAPLHYGPPGASLNTAGQPGKVEVVDSTALGSKALRITRDGPPETEVEAVVGDIGEMPYASGKAYVELRAHGETIPSYDFAGVIVSVRSEGGFAALSMRLYDGAYHLSEAGSYTQIVGSYDPAAAHSVHIELDLDTRKYLICINDEEVVSDKTFASASFDSLYMLKFYTSPTILEAFGSVYVVDDIRVTK